LSDIVLQCVVSVFFNFGDYPSRFNATWSVELRKNDHAHHKYYLLHTHGLSAWGEPGGLANYKPSRNGNNINGWGAECYPSTFFGYFSTTIVLSGSLQGNRYLGVPVCHRDRHQALPPPPPFLLFFSLLLCFNALILRLQYAFQRNWIQSAAKYSLSSMAFSSSNS
jgi:hypothetical protein